MKLTTSRSQTCCFSGYRPEKLPWRYKENDTRCVALKARLYEAVDAAYSSGIRHFICGMAQGSDMYFCEAVLRLREGHPDVTLEAALPCEDQASRWQESQRDRYFRLVELCDVETLLSGRYTPDCMTRRNIYMVDHSAVLITVYDGRFGGTMHTVGYATKQGLNIIRLEP